MGRDKIKICFLSYRPNYGGVTTFQCNYLIYLANNCNLYFIDECTQITIDRLPLNIIAKIVFYKIPIWSKALRTTIVLLRTIIGIRPDLIIINNYGVLVKHFLVLFIIKYCLKINIMLINHSTLLTFTARGKFLELLGSIAMLVASDLVYVSYYTKHSWEKRYFWLTFIKSRIVHNGVLFPKLKKDEKKVDGCVRIGFVGRINNEKNWTLFCEISIIAQRLNKPFRFIVFGNADRDDIALNPYIPPSVELRGEKYSTDDIYPNIDILLVTSRIENCPFSVLEAKAYGIPVIAFNVGGLSEIIENYKDGILVNDSEGIFEAISLIQDKYTEYSSNCLENRATYNIERTGTLLFNKYLAIGKN